MSLIEIKNLKNSSDDVPVLKGISLSVEAGAVVALIGKSG